MIWEDGYRNGEYKAHFYPEVAAVLSGWHAEGKPLYVYSSGSVPAQKQFFGFSEAGDLTGLVSGWFDTEIGGKREAESYRNIVKAIGVPAGQIVFLSDVVEELDAAREGACRPACWTARTITRCRAPARPRTAMTAWKISSRSRCNRFDIGTLQGPLLVESVPNRLPVVVRYLFNA